MKLSLFQLSCTVALCLFFSTVNSVVEGQLRGASTKPRQLQEGAVAEAMGDGNEHTHNSEHTHHSRKSMKEKKVKKVMKAKKGPTTGGVAGEEVTGDVQEAMVFVVDSNTTAIDDDDMFSNSTAVDDDDIASNSTAVDDIASNSTADDELDESDADEEEGEGEVRY
mmetsp:Transcript_4104/g.4586  ORF Transcript_4104/g.4586 Transcript_4104/m.4586 type:complete len:166 (+) Transcript_4104:132-629(+)